MLDPAAHCLGASYSCWELLGQEFFSPCPTYIVLLWRLTEICWQKHSLPPKNTLQKESFFFFFWRRQPPQLPCIAILVSWYHLLNNCVCCYSCHPVSAVLPGPLRGLEFSWPGIWCRSTFTVPHSPSGLWLFQVVSCLVSTFCSRQEAADSLLCDRWSSLR